MMAWKYRTRSTWPLSRGCGRRRTTDEHARSGKDARISIPELAEQIGVSPGNGESLGAQQARSPRAQPQGATRPPFSRWRGVIRPPRSSPGCVRGIRTAEARLEPGAQRRRNEHNGRCAQFPSSRTPARLPRSSGATIGSGGPHEPQYECPTAIFGLVLERGTYFSRFDKEHHTARVLTADNIVWSVIGFHGWLQSELERKNPQVGDFVGIAFTGTKPARREGESPAFTYRVEVVRNPNPTDPAETSESPGGDDAGSLPTTTISVLVGHVELRPARAIRARTQAGRGSQPKVGCARAGRLGERTGRGATRRLLRVEADLARGTRSARRAGRGSSREQGRARLRG